MTKHDARGWCPLHYNRWRNHGDPLWDPPIKRVIGTICEVADCGKARYQLRRYCVTHSRRLYRYGDLTTDRTKIAVLHVDSTGYQRRSDVREHRPILLAKIGPGEHPCHWCQRPVSWDRSYPRDVDGLVVDHLDENKQNNDPANLVPSCNPCNMRRFSLGRKRDADLRWLPRPTAEAVAS